MLGGIVAVMIIAEDDSGLCRIARHVGFAAGERENGGPEKQKQDGFHESDIE